MTRSNYGSALALHAVGVWIRQSRSVALDGTLSVAMILYALLAFNIRAPWPACPRSW
jgi:hypothetical protein